MSPPPVRATFLSPACRSYSSRLRRGTRSFAAPTSRSRPPTCGPALQIIEREFGLLEIHSRTQAEVKAAGEAVLEYLGLTERGPRCGRKSRRRNSSPTSTPTRPNSSTSGARAICCCRAVSLFVLEAAPAAYVTLAANEAEKAANISLIEVRAVGRFGRLFISGTESEAKTASEGGDRRA